MKPYSPTLHITKTVKLNYLLHLPPQMADKPGELWPTILFLHGFGESGDNSDVVMTQGLPRYLADHPDFPFIVIAPQCPWQTWWPELADALDVLLDECAAAYPIDPHRLYLTGLSMGGYGTWYLGTKWPQRFAAIAPICGGGYWFHGFPQRVERLKNVPVWAFHGALDPVVPLEASQLLINTLTAVGGKAQLTIYPNADHDSWTETYNNSELYTWFLQHSLKTERLQFDDDGRNPSLTRFLGFG
ncbi:MAG: prolyl oligopeptidase family serine peptidase [Candidatus Promineifilaceae bacterium]